MLNNFKDEFSKQKLFSIILHFVFDYFDIPTLTKNLRFCARKWFIDGIPKCQEGLPITKILPGTCLLAIGSKLSGEKEVYLCK